MQESSSGQANAAEESFCLLDSWKNLYHDEEMHVSGRIVA